LTFIDSTVTRTVDILNKLAGSQDTDSGLYTAGEATIQSDIVCDIQPTAARSDKVMRTINGEDVIADYLMFTQTFLTGAIRIFHTVKDQADSVEYEIVGIDDLRDHWEFFLRREDRDGV